MQKPSCRCTGDRSFSVRKYSFSSSFAAYSQKASVVVVVVSGRSIFKFYLVILRASTLISWRPCGPIFSGLLLTFCAHNTPPNNSAFFFRTVPEQWWEVVQADSAWKHPANKNGHYSANLVGGVLWGGTIRELYTACPDACILALRAVRQSVCAGLQQHLSCISHSLYGEEEKVLNNYGTRSESLKSIFSPLFVLLTYNLERATLTCPTNFLYGTCRLKPSASIFLPFFFF